MNIANNITELIGKTPMIRLSKIQKTFNGAEIVVKMELLNPGGSVKDRPCLSMINKAEKNGNLKSGSTIIEPTTGNTGIGLAMIAAVKGYKCIITMPEDFSLERIYLLKNYGAQVVLTPAKLGVRGAIDKAIDLHKSIPNSFIPLQFESEANPRAHRDTTAQEIVDDCDGKIDAFVAGVGTGGTITGVGEVLKKLNPQIKIIAVEPDASAVLSGKKMGRHKIQGIGAGFIPTILNRDIIDEIITIKDQESYEMARRLGREEGLCVGMSSGANVIAAIRIAEKIGQGKRVVTLLCDTGERYFSTEQFFET